MVLCLTLCFHSLARMPDIPCVFVGHGRYTHNYDDDRAQIKYQNGRNQEMEYREGIEEVFFDLK